MKKQTNNQNTTRIEKLWKYWCFPSFHLFKFMLLLFRLCEHKHRLTWSLASCVSWCEIRRFVGQSPPPLSLLYGCCHTREKKGKKFVCAEFWVSFGKAKTRGEGNGVQKGGSCFFATGESVANSYGALQQFGCPEKFLRREVGWKPDGCE